MKEYSPVLFLLLLSKFTLLSQGAFYCLSQRELFIAIPQLICSRTRKTTLQDNMGQSTAALTCSVCEQETVRDATSTSVQQHFEIITHGATPSQLVEELDFKPNTRVCRFS